MSQSDGNKLQVLQNSCIRICLKCDKCEPRKEMYLKSGIEPLEVQMKWNTAGIVYLGLDQESTPLANNLFSEVNNKAARVLRSEVQENVVVPKTKLNVCRGNIRYQGPVVYNQIDREIHTAKTFKTFKKRLKRNKVFDTYIS